MSDAARFTAAEAVCTELTLTHHTFKLPGGNVVTSDVIVVPEAVWRMLAEAGDSRWSTIVLPSLDGPIVHANRVLG
jgi:hypothetical protein